MFPIGHFLKADRTSPDVTQKLLKLILREACNNI